MNDRLRNKIDLLICEEAIGLFEKNNRYQTFANWCNKLRLEINSYTNSKSKQGWVSKETVDLQAQLIEYIMNAFGFNVDEGYHFVKAFFINKQYLHFESVAKETKLLFDSPLNKSK